MILATSLDSQSSRKISQEVQRVSARWFIFSEQEYWKESAKRNLASESLLLSSRVTCPPVQLQLRVWRLSKQERTRFLICFNSSVTFLEKLQRQKLAENRRAQRKGYHVGEPMIKIWFALNCFLYWEYHWYPWKSIYFSPSLWGGRTSKRKPILI